MNTLNQQLNPLNALVPRWILRPENEVKMLAFLYWIAAASPDGVIRQSMKEIAKGANFRLKTAQSMIATFISAGILEIAGITPEQEYPLQIPRRYLMPPNNPTSVLNGLSLSELVRYLTGYWPSPKTLAALKSAANDDEEHLQECLASLLQKRIMTHQDGRRTIRRVFMIDSLSELTSAVRDETNSKTSEVIGTVR